MLEKGSGFTPVGLSGNVTSTPGGPQYPRREETPRLHPETFRNKLMACFFISRTLLDQPTELRDTIWDA